MIFQRVLKGIVGVTDQVARRQLDGPGLTCRWWNEVNPLPVDAIPERLSEDNLLRHLNAYDRVDPSLPAPFGQEPFGKYTPFISTTAGTVERDPTRAQNRPQPALITALSFATANFQKEGAIYYCYVNVLGKRSVKLQEFSEETRDLHLWTDFQPYHPEGEIVAKISIPSPHIQKVEGYDGPRALTALDRGQLPVPLWTEINYRHYVPPETVSNIRDFL